eukprot:CAMPEP_0201490592 /NCGR_PEP_ID=MMETSP0151_2-20130828/26649_1 /ASSEMBLY_ACC=CAM_ASM_000257 /TAXON_ID=200890 /ORGANISM="Paramoeba atlantica, Strain 621/1 / CCAP 1560/9" /LENGTH=623 /DNA_ID=CAMNT_0047876593 /DNA_START=35 /DNA_END=1906 /DNA_ORIENTATION=-
MEKGEGEATTSPSSERSKKSPRGASSSSSSSSKGGSPKSPRTSSPKKEKLSSPQRSSPVQESQTQFVAGEKHLDVDASPAQRRHVSHRRDAGRSSGSLIGSRGRSECNSSGGTKSPRRAPHVLRLGDLSASGELEESAADAESGKGSKVKSARTPRSFFWKRSSKGKVDDEEVLKEGWLHIRKAGKGSLKKYWFVITIGTASYFSDQTYKTKRGEIDLRKSTTQVVLRGSANDQCMFGLISSSRDYDLKANLVEEVGPWIRAIESAMVNEVSIPNSPRSSPGQKRLSNTHQEPVNLGKYRTLIDILTSEKEIDLVRAMCRSINKKDERALALGLIHIFELKGKSYDLLSTWIADSVEACSVATTLFRGNSVTEKGLTVYCHLVGTDYLKRCLKPLFLAVVNSDAEYEIDPNKVRAGSSVEANVVNLLSVSQMFMAKITASKFTNVPFGIRRVSRYLATTTKEKFPDGLYSIIGGLFFLRFVCPALLVPTEIGIWDGEFSSEAKRALLLISKTLMNLSNGVKFGKKEQFMTPMNDFIVSNEGAIRRFFDSLIIPTEEQDPGQREEERQQLKAEEERVKELQPDFTILEEFRLLLKQDLPAMIEKVSSEPALVDRLTGIQKIVEQ